MSRAVAITAVARKLATIAYLMLKNDEPYRYAKPELMREEFAKLRDTGPSPDDGSPTPGRRVKAGAGLVEVYRAAGLPPVTPPEDLPAGERRMLEERGLEDLLRDVYRASGPDTGVHRAEPRRGATPRSSKSRQPSGRPSGRPG
jgi:hypothetical protein